MKIFNFEPFDGHIIAHIDENKVLVDTGSPVTIGVGKDLPSFGSPLMVESLPGCTVLYLGDLLHYGFDVLLGCDVLGRQPFLVDWPARTITFGPLERPDGIVIPLDSIGVPVIAARIDGKDVRLALDTGAKVTFLKHDLIRDAAEVGTYDDFYPTIGAFTCGSFEKTVSVGGISLDLTAGELPPSLESSLGSIGLDGILGNDIFDHYPKVLYDLQNRTLTLAR